MACDSPDHLCQELVVDCGYTRVFASRVGALGSSFVRAAKPGDCIRAKRDKPPTDANSYIPRFPPGKLREFTLEELEKATGNFSGEQMIGRGGFGTVFRGILSDGAVVAVKVMHSVSEESLEQFQAEMRVSCAIMSLSHPNLVPVIGFHSSHKRKRAKGMTVYPFMANGDLSHYLVDRQPSSLTPLDWPTRKRIALGVARGICRLHQLGIVHRDIKPSNVMLDGNFDAYIGDFGLAKSMDLPHNNYEIAGFHGDVDSNHYDVTRVLGTLGYISPEMFLNGHFSRKSDVYAFGVTLIQIVTGKRKFYLEAGNNSEFFYFPVQQIKNKENLTRHMHPAMLGMYNESEAIELIQLGLVCTQYDPRKRPPMPEVIAMMNGSSATLKQRWDNYDGPWITWQMSSDNPSAIDSDISLLSKRNSSVGAGGSERGDDDEELRCSYGFDINEEELEENGDDRNPLRQAEDFESEESNKEYRAGNVGHQLHGYLSGVSCYNAVQPGDASSGVSGAESTSLANSRSLKNDTWTEIVEVDQNEKGNSKQLILRANQHEVATKLREVQDEMWEMELKHQAAMEEMHQKQIAIMQSMIKMQEQYIQKVNEMRSQMNQLKGEKP